MKTIYQITFIDNNNNKCNLTIETVNDTLVFMASYRDYYGFNCEEINPTVVQKPLIEYWKKYNGKKEYNEKELIAILEKVKKEEEKKEEKIKTAYFEQFTYDSPEYATSWIMNHKSCDKLIAQKFLALMILQNCVLGDIDYINFDKKCNTITLYGTPFACDIVNKNYFDGTCTTIDGNIFRITAL